MTTGARAERNTRRWEREHPERFKADRKARSKVNNAVRDGRVKKPSTADKCPHCGKTGGRKEYHHQGSNPGWRCSKCHPRGGAVGKKS